MIVDLEEKVAVGLHLGEIVVPDFAALDAEALVEQGAVEAFEVTVVLWTAHLGCGGRCLRAGRRARKGACRDGRRTPFIVGQLRFQQLSLKFSGKYPQ